MRFAWLVLVLLSRTVSHAEAPKQLPKKCVAESPSDAPCTGFAGTYHLRILPSDKDKKCVITAPLEADVEIGKPLQKGLVVVDAKALVKKLGWTQRANDEHEAGAAIREGVCCVDVRLTQTTGKPKDETERRLIVHMARGASVVNAIAQERIMPDHGDDCQNEIAVEATLVHK